MACFGTRLLSLQIVQAMLNTRSMNISSDVGGISDAKVRFRWIGDGTGWWAVDNFKVYAPLALDAAIQNISNPRMPFQAGLQDINVDVSNLGINTITSLNLNWEINGYSNSF